MRFAWDFFRHYLLSHRAGALIRTVAWLCMCGVGLGVMSLVVVISVMNGFNDSIRRRLLAVEPHLVVRVPKVETVEGLYQLPLYKQLKARKDIQAEIYENQDVILRTVDGVFGGAVAKGIEPQTLGYILQEVQKASGGQKTNKDLSIDPKNLGAGEILVGIDLARGLGIFEGDKLTIIPPEALLLPPGEAPRFETVIVKGLITTNIQDIDSKVMFYSRGASLLSFRKSPSHEVGYELRFDDPDKAFAMGAELNKKGAIAANWAERNSALFYALKMEKMAMGTFLTLSAVIASFSIVTVLVLLLMQKRKDIGMLMSLGLSPRKTRWLFVRVGLLLSSIGIFGGIAAGVIICLIVDRYPLPILPDIYYDATIPAKVDPRFIAGVLFVASLIAFFSAYLPAKSVTSETPADALGGKFKKV